MDDLTRHVLKAWLGWMVFCAAIGAFFLAAAVYAIGKYLFGWW